MKRYRLFISLVGLTAVLGFVTMATAGGPGMEDCALAITKIQSFSTGAGALRNTSTICGQTGGNSKTKSVTVVVSLIDGAVGSCTSDREVTVDLQGASETGGTDPFVFNPGQAEITRIISPGGSGRFKFSARYDQTSCLNGEGPLAKSRDGVNQENTPGFRWDATATKIRVGDPPGTPTGDSDDDDMASAFANLTCKPCRTE